MGWVMMSERELHRVEVLTSILTGRSTVGAGAAVLAMSPRQVPRLLAAYKQSGAAALRHGSRGRRSNRAKSDDLRELALSTVREKYADFGPTFAAEMLRDRHGLTLSRETLHRWMTQADLWQSRQQLRQFTSLGCGANALANWSRSTAVSIVGSRIGDHPARRWCSSTTPRVG